MKNDIQKVGTANQGCVSEGHRAKAAGSGMLIALEERMSGEVDGEGHV